MGFPGSSVVKNLPDNGRRPGLNPERMKWQPTPVFLPGKSQEQKNLTGLQFMRSQRAEHNLAYNNNKNRLILLDNFFFFLPFSGVCFHMSKVMLYSVGLSVGLSRFFSSSIFMTPLPCALGKSFSL